MTITPTGTIEVGFGQVKFRKSSSRLDTRIACHSLPRTVHKVASNDLARGRKRQPPPLTALDEEPQMTIQADIQQLQVMPQRDADRQQACAEAPRPAARTSAQMRGAAEILLMEATMWRLRNPVGPNHGASSSPPPSAMPLVTAFVRFSNFLMRRG